METTPCSLPGRLLRPIADYLSLEDWVTFFEALASTSQKCELSLNMGRTLVKKIEFKQDLEQSDPTFNMRKRNLLEKGHHWTKARWIACKEEATRAIHFNKEKIHLVTRIVANTEVTPSARETILQYLVEKIVETFSVNIRFSGEYDNAGRRLYKGSNHPNRLRPNRCYLCEKVYSRPREVIRFQIILNPHCKGKPHNSCDSPLPDENSKTDNQNTDNDFKGVHLHTDIEGFLLTRQVLGAQRVKFVEGLGGQVRTVNPDTAYVPLRKDTNEWCRHQSLNYWQLLDLLGETLSGYNFLSLTGKLEDQLLETEPHKKCRACNNGWHALDTYGTCFNNPNGDTIEEEEFLHNSPETENDDDTDNGKR